MVILSSKKSSHVGIYVLIAWTMRKIGTIDQKQKCGKSFCSLLS